MIITKTPFRMSFFGGGTDMESFFRENGGAVLSTTFDKYCYVNVRHLPRFFDYSTELSYSKTERVTNIDDIQSYMIGDGENDIKAGLAARCKSILVNGNGTDTKNEDFGQIDTLASVLEFVDKYLC